jgi:hypothetical protein
MAILLWRSFFPAYMHKKGEDLATKEDIAEITNEVERVKSLYREQRQELEHRNTRFLEDLRSTQQLRMAAIEKRLHTHQHAFTLWRKLVSSAFSDDVVSVVMECQDFWNRNCLYLSPAAREAFQDAYFAAKDHRQFVEARMPGNEVRENWLLIIKAGEAIVSGVELPTLGEREAQDIRDEQTRPSQSDAS